MDTPEQSSDESTRNPTDPELPSVLIVDDQATNRALIRAHLAPHYEVCEANEGASAVEILKRRKVDLVLLDVMMPHMSGYAVCRLIKKQMSPGEYLPVVLLTALGQQEDRNTGLAAGADDFLTKPVNRDELVMRVKIFVKLRRQNIRIRQQLADLEKRDQLIRSQLDELRAVDALKDELVSLMVHDLRNPLGGIAGFLGTLPDELDDEQLRAEAHMAIDASERLRETLDDILQVRMLESGNVQLRREQIDADGLVRDAIASVHGAARARQVRITPVTDISHLRVAADRKLVRRAIENLLTNALKYSPAGGIVSAAIHPVGDDVEIEVADSGTGIPDTLKEQLFQKFGSVEIAKGGPRRGIGLGLYLVKLVANVHGGRAVVRDREGGGTAFGLVLPKLETSS